VLTIPDSKPNMQQLNQDSGYQKVTL